MKITPQTFMSWWTLVPIVFSWLYGAYSFIVDPLQEQITSLETKIEALTALQEWCFPEWVRDSSGHFMSVNSEFMRLFWQPYWLIEKDFIGKTFREIGVFDEDLLVQLEKIDTLAVKYGMAWDWNVQITHDLKAIVIKRVSNNGTENVFIWELVPQYE